MAKSRRVRKVSAAQKAAAASSAAALVRSKRGAQASLRSAFHKAKLDSMSEAERKLALMPKLINGRVILSDGRPREIQPDPITGFYIARYSVGEFWIVNLALEPVKRATEQMAARAGFRPPLTLKRALMGQSATENERALR